MANEQSGDSLVLVRLRALGVELLAEWDVLVFLYRHAASLGTATQIAQALGYDKAETAMALRKLETLRLIQRSRDSQGIRFYLFSAAPDSAHHSALLELMSVAQDRTGRLLLLKHLKRPQREPRGNRHSGLRLA